MTDWARINNPFLLVAAAKTNEAAREEAMKRVISTMLDLCLNVRHENTGYPPYSSAALAQGGSGHSDIDPMEAAYSRLTKQGRPWYQLVEAFMGLLPRRQVAAILLQSARVSRERSGGEWCLTMGQLIAQQDERLRLLDMGDVERFPTVRALQECAQAGRKKLYRILEGDAERVA